MPNSGMASSAEKLLHFYGLNEQNTQWTYRYFTQLKEDASIDAAVVTAGILNADLNLFWVVEAIGFFLWNTHAFAKRTLTFSLP